MVMKMKYLPATIMNIKKASLHWLHPTMIHARWIYIILIDGSFSTIIWHWKKN